MDKLMDWVATWIVLTLGVYAGFGLLFAAVFVLRGAQRVDPRAEGGSWGFRLAIAPGVAALWPILVRRWLGGGPPPEESNAHRRAAGKVGRS